MGLSTRQLSTLATMGIPVWEYRTEDVVSELENDTLSQEMHDRLLDCQCWVVSDKLEDERMHRLLHAMLFSIGIDPSQFVVIHPEHSAEIEQLDASKKVILILGELQNTHLADKSTSVVSHSLLSLLEHPKLKSEVWLALQRVKQALAQC
ncbi:DNA polymerase III subunit psi [Pseudomonadota bacterium]|nr:DNA polymerase III subunit psi [Pseudomonadota bacterium]